jgi:transposase
VDWNCAVLHRELHALGYQAGVLQVQRYVQPRRAARRWAAVATVRFETAPGQQGQVDFGQLRLWIGERPETAHLLVFTLGYSRRLWVQAYPHERLDVVIAAHEGAFHHFGGLPLECLYDNVPAPGRGAGGRPRALASGLRGFRPLLGFHPAGLPALPGSDQGQDRKRGQVRQAQCARRPPLRLLEWAE